MLALSRHGSPALPPLVLLHGFLGSKSDWSGVLPLLQRHFYCLCLDLPGHGDSRHIDLPTPGFSACAELIRQTLAAEGITRFHLHGYSLGGRLALHLARDFPDILLSLSLESCHPGLQDDAERTSRSQNDALWARRLAELPIIDFLDLWYRQGVFAELSAGERHKLIDRRRHNDPRALHNCYLATSLAQQGDLWSLPATLLKPCHYHVGSRDSKFSALATRWQRLTNLALHTFAGAGHNVHLAAPEAWSRRLIAQLSGTLA